MAGKPAGLQSGWMSNNNAATVDVQFSRIDAQKIMAVDCLASISLVNLPKADVIDRKARAS